MKITLIDKTLDVLRAADEDPLFRDILLERLTGDKPRNDPQTTRKGDVIKDLQTIKPR